VLWRLVGRLWGSTEVLGGLRGEGPMLLLHKCSLPPPAMPPNADHLQGVVPTQKLERVTPKISLIDAGSTDSKAALSAVEGGNNFPQTVGTYGPVPS